MGRGKPRTLPGTSRTQAPKELDVPVDGSPATRDITAANNKVGEALGERKQPAAKATGKGSRKRALDDCPALPPSAPNVNLQDRSNVSQEKPPSVMTSRHSMVTRRKERLAASNTATPAPVAVQQTLPSMLKRKPANEDQQASKKKIRLIPDTNADLHTVGGTCKLVDRFDSADEQLDILMRRTRVCHQYMNKHPISAWMRATVIEWMLEVGADFRLLRSTVHLAISIFDRFLDQARTLVQKYDLQSCATTSLFIASKFEEVQPPTIDDFEKVASGATTTGSILMDEEDILITLSWQIVATTPAHWIPELINVLCSDPSFPSSRKDLIIHEAMLIADLCMLDFRSVPFTSLEISLACILAVDHKVDNMLQTLRRLLPTKSVDCPKECSSIIQDVCSILSSHEDEATGPRFRFKPTQTFHFSKYSKDHIKLIRERVPPPLPTQESEEASHQPSSPSPMNAPPIFDDQPDDCEADDDEGGDIESACWRLSFERSMSELRKKMTAPVENYEYGVCEEEEYDEEDDDEEEDDDDDDDDDLIAHETLDFSSF